jgi:hypothetical protein
VAWVGAVSGSVGAMEGQEGGGGLMLHEPQKEHVP